MYIYFKTVQGGHVSVSKMIFYIGHLEALLRDAHFHFSFSPSSDGGDLSGSSLSA